MGSTGCHQPRVQYISLAGRESVRSAIADALGVTQHRGDPMFIQLTDARRF